MGNAGCGVLAIAAAMMILVAVEARSLVPCYFIFGDSLLDNGNNNALKSLAKANYVPYGVDFPAGPTGRFTNGKTTADVIAEHLGFKGYIPSFASASGAKSILRGVNFASAGSGIREETGRHLGERMSMNSQLINYQRVVGVMRRLLGGQSAMAEYLKHCVYTVAMGSNDYLNNYYMPLLYNSSGLYTPQQYATILVHQYSQQLRELYTYGARKVAVMGIGPVGCAPGVLVSSGTPAGTCAETINTSNRLFNDHVKSMVKYFNRNLTDARFTYVDVYGIFQDMRNNPSSFGFQVTDKACCGGGEPKNGKVSCFPLQIPCTNRTDHVFWDDFHPTEAANFIIGARAYRMHKPSDAHPMDIKTLALTRI